MPFDVARWQILLGAQDTSAAAFNSLQQRMRQLQIVAGGVQQGMTAAFGGITRMLGPLAAGFTAAAAAQKIWAAGMKAADMGEQAEQIGLTTDQLQAYRLEAAQNGVTVEQLDGAMMRLTRSMGEANGGNEEIIATFDRLGVKLLDAEKNLRKPADVLPELARGLLQVKSETERNALMMTFFGRSGARMVTILSALAEGNDALIDKARQANAVMDAETIRTWDRVGNQMAIAQQQASTLFAQLGAPIADVGLDAVNWQLKELNQLLKDAKIVGAWLFDKGSQVLGTDLAGMQRDSAKFLSQMTQAQKDIEEAEKRIASNPNSMIAQRELGAAQKKLEWLRGQYEDVNSKIAQQMTAAYVPTMEPIVVKGGDGQPLGKNAGKGGTSGVDPSIREAQRQMDELVASIEAVRKASEGVLDKYGDGTARAARETEALNEMLERRYINEEVYARALKDITAAQQEQSIAIRGSAESFDAYFAGMESIINQSSRASRAFQYGEKTVQLMDEAIEQLVQNGEINFNRLLSSFVTMLIQMEMRAAASSLFGAMGGGAGGLISGLIGRIFSSAVSVPGIAGGPVAVGGIPTVPAFADGGRPPVGRLSLVGERGPELFVPDSAGTIIPNSQLGNGGDSVVVSMSNSFGGGVTHAEMLRYGAMIEERARAGAMAGIEEKRKRGGSIKQVFR